MCAFPPRIQAMIRGHQQYSEFRATRFKIVLLQKYIRRFLCMRHYANVRLHILKISSVIRGFLVRRRAMHMRRQFRNKPPSYWASLIKGLLRGNVVRKQLEAKYGSKYLRIREGGRIILQAQIRTDSATMINGMIKGFIMRKRYDTLRKAVNCINVRLYICCVLCV